MIILKTKMMLQWIQNIAHDLVITRNQYKEQVKAGDSKRNIHQQMMRCYTNISIYDKASTMFAQTSM